MMKPDFTRSGPNYAKNFSQKMPEILKLHLLKPLIVGASVSANHRGVASPGRQLALRATHSEAIQTLAKSGKPARDILGAFDSSLLKERSIVIGIDLLFWDSTLPDLEQTQTRFNAFVSSVVSQQIPLVLGEVPGFFPPLQPSLNGVNELILQVKKNYEKCVVLPFDSIYHQILNDGSFHYRGVNYSIHELIPDGLHLSTLAGKVLADVLQDELVRNLHRL